jgi:hypothetical protein
MESDQIREKLDVLIHLACITVLPDEDPKVRARVLRDAGVDISYLTKHTGLTAASINALGVSGRKKKPVAVRKK